MVKLLYTTDVHGSVEIYERLFAAGSRKEIGAVIIGGDTSPGFQILLQRRFFQEYLIPRAAAFKQDFQKPVFYIMGNDDFKVNADLIEQAAKAGALDYLHMTARPFAGFSFSGYTCINPSPFFIKDWERQEPEIRQDLDRLWSLGTGTKRILVFHAPPHQTALDVIWSGEHVGSRAIRAFIEERQPLLTLHGHIHESFDLTGRYQERIGRTLCVNPGNRNFAIVDLEDLSVRHQKIR